MKRWLLILSLLISAAVNAQAVKPATYNTRLQLELENYASPQSQRGVHLSGNVINAVGFSVQQKLTNKLYLKLGGQTWHIFQKQFTNTHSEIFENKDIGFLNSKPGSLWYRGRYSMADLVFGYTKAFRRQDVYANAGLSYAEGTNTFLVSAFSTGCELFIDTRDEKAHYFGPTFELGYNYHTVHDRINIGPSLNARYYPGQFSQYTLKLNLGYNFGRR